MGLSSSRHPRLVPRLNYVDPWDIPAMESWLVQMAAQGLYFVRCSKGLLWFRRDTPGAVRYRLDAISPLSPTPDLETFQQAREMGWLYVGKLGQFSLYRCDDPDAPELHTDPLTQSMTLELLEQSIRRNVSLCTPLFLLGIGMILAGFLGGRPPVLQLVESSAAFSMLVSLLLDLIVLVWLLLQCRRFCRLRRSLREGNPMEHRTGRFRGQVARSRFLILFALLFAVLSAGISVRSISGSAGTSRRSSPLPSPFISPTLRPIPPSPTATSISQTGTWKITYKRRGPSSPPPSMRSRRAARSPAGTGRITAGPIPPPSASPTTGSPCPSWRNPSSGR